MYTNKLIGTNMVPVFVYRFKNLCIIKLHQFIKGELIMKNINYIGIGIAWTGAFISGLALKYFFEKLTQYDK